MGRRGRPGLVHRLDKGTSGVLLVAKTRAAHAGLGRALKARRIEKEYLALVYGRPRRRRGRIEARSGPTRRTAGGGSPRGRRAATRHALAAARRFAGERAGLAPSRCRSATGRTHQIRVHLAWRGLPIAGDPLYGEPRWKGIADPALAALCRDFPRQALHARRLAFPHPATGARLVVEAPVPADLSRLLAAAGLPAAG